MRKGRILSKHSMHGKIAALVDEAGLEAVHPKNEL